MKKRFISTILVLCMVIMMLPAHAFGAPAGAGKNPFTDVSPNSWYYDAVSYAYENKLFTGIDNVTFSPNGTMTRGMYVTAVGRMVGIDVADYTAASAFKDVPSNAYYAPYVNWAEKTAITAGITKDEFRPNDLVTRQQMAAFTVRLFSAMNYKFPESTVTGTPKDFKQIQDYAKEPALQLWACGMLIGDNGNFNPQQATRRAEAASFLMRVHTYLAEEYPDNKPDNPSNPDIPDPTKYHAVTFALGGQADADVSLPKDKPYPENTKITSFPTPLKKNSIFLGWYYDAEMTQGIESDDVLDRDITVYAKMAAADSVSEIEIPTYVTDMDVNTSYSFQVKAASENDVKAALVITQITANNAEVEYVVSAGGSGLFTITSSNYTPGQTYRASLTADAGVVFVLNGEAQPKTVCSLNFVTKMEEVQNLEIRENLIYIPVDDGSVSNMTGTATEGLMSIALQNNEAFSVNENTSEGTFEYTGATTINIGDTVSLYKGIKPSARTSAETDGSVVYVTITAKTDNTYTYTSAQAEDVLFTPDILPVDSSDNTDGSVDVGSAALDFSDPQYAAIGLDATTTLDVGDYIAFYTGSTDDGMSGNYGIVTGISLNGDTYTIAYTASTEDEMLKTMDIYSKRNQKIEMTDEERKAIEDEMEKQAEESGFVETAGEYLTALALETDGFQELNDNMDLSGYDIEFEKGSQQELNEMDLMKTTVKITEQKIQATVAVGANALNYFEGGDGIRAELALVFEVEISGESGNSIVINLSAVFAQEVLLNIDISGGAKWEKHRGLYFISDYYMNANLDFGSYTAIAITATAYTKGAEDDDDKFEWKTPSGTSKLEDRMISIGAQITALMEKQEELEGEDIEFAGNPPSGLAAKYGEMIEAAEDCWIDLFRVTIFEAEGFVDPFHILAFGIGADFVVSANMYITLGMTFEYATAKRYNFSLGLFSHKTTNETIDLEPAHYEFEFYVMGTLGIRAGIEFEMAIGLFSLKLDKIGITAEAGAYAQLWGYFHYMLKWAQNEGRSSDASGALYLELGAYLEIGLIAQLFSSDKLTFAPTLYENKWPIWSVGEAENVNDFAYAQNETPEFILYNLKTQRMPDNLFTMGYMDLTSGESGLEKAFAPNRFHVEFTNPAFSYSKSTGIITVNPEPAGSLSEGGEMKITWGGAPLAFTSKPITRVMAITWAQQNEGRFIAFDTMGGSIVPMLFERPDTAITLPEAPTKQGYVFDGWYNEKELSTSFNFPTTMPDYEASGDDLRGVMVYAKWVPARDTQYTVRYWQHTLGGNSYTKVDTKSYNDGVTDSLTTVGADKLLSYTGFTAQEPVTQQMVEPDGSTIINVYYSRNIHDLTFVHGKGGEDVVYKMKYGAKVYSPQLTAGGYRFSGFNDSADLPGFIAGTSTMPDQAVTFTANWTASSYSVTLVLGGGLTNPEQLTYTAGVGVALPSSISETREGYTFDGWCTNAAGRGDPVTAVSQTDSGYKTFYAKWIPNSYKISFNGNSDTSDTMVDQSFAYGTAQTLTKNGFTRAGFIFKGWGTSADASVVIYADKASVSNLTSQDGGTITLYAIWEAGEGTIYTVRHLQQNANDSGYTEVTGDVQELTGKTGQLTAATANTYSGFAIGVVTQVSIKGDGSTVVDIKYNRSTYMLTWTANGGTLGGSYSGKNTKGMVRFGATITAPTLSKAGYSGTWNLEIPATMPAENCTFAAQWEEAGFALTFTQGAGVYVDSYTPPTSFFEGQVVTLPTAAQFKYHTEADASGNGWVFLGWYKDRYFTGEPCLTTEGLRANTTFHAKWFTGKAITTDAQLIKIKDNLTASYCLYGDITTSNGGWSAIPGIFSGKLYGNGHTITFGGLPMLNYGGLFQEIGSAGVVDGITITGGIKAPGNVAVNAGGIAAMCAGTISNCTAVDLNLTNIDESSLDNYTNAIAKEGTRHTGAIAGANSGIILNCTVKNSSINASSRALLPVSKAIGCANVGGVVGRNTGMISGCTATDGRVSTTTSNWWLPGTYGDPHVISVGGIVGANTKTIQKCSTQNMQINSVKHEFNADGQGIKSNSEDVGANAGGITGSNYGESATITDCSVKGGTVGGLKCTSGTNSRFSGGIIGINFGGTLSKNQVDGLKIKSGGHIGGIAGKNEMETAKIQECGVTNLTIEWVGGLQATNGIGGLVGLVGDNSTLFMGHAVSNIVQDCTAENVTILISPAKLDHYGLLIGGAVGIHSGDLTRIAVKNVTVTAVGTSSDQKPGATRIGGLVGHYEANRFHLTVDGHTSVNMNRPLSYKIEGCSVSDFSATITQAGTTEIVFGGLVGRTGCIRDSDNTFDPHTATFKNCVVGSNVTFTPFNGTAQPASNFLGQHNPYDTKFSLIDGGGNTLAGNPYVVTKPVI